MKYIIFEGNGLAQPVIFGDHTTHAQISVKGARPVSAGFVRFDAMAYPHCYGRSDSLDLENRGKIDETVIRQAQIGCDASAFMI